MCLSFHNCTRGPQISVAHNIGKKNNNNNKTKQRNTLTISLWDVRNKLEVVSQSNGENNSTNFPEEQSFIRGDCGIFLPVKTVFRVF